MKRKHQNYLDFIPDKNIKMDYQKNEYDHIIIIQHHTNIWNRLFHKILGKAESTKIELDSYGSCIWEKINGQKSIYEIGKEMYAIYGTEMEPLYERLAAFMRTLEMRGCICMRKTMD